MAELTLKECWGNGLTPKRDMARDLGYCSTFKGLIPLGPRGARKPRNPTYPLDSPAQSVTFPFPQILRDEKTVLAFTSASAVYEVPYTGSYPWTATALPIYSGIESVVNGRFDEDASWTKGSGWTISGGTANASTASATLAQAGILTNGVTYRIKFTITRSAGSITPTFGSTAGTTRSTSGTFSEEVTSNNTDFSFATSGFTGTVDNVSIRAVVTPGGSKSFRLVSFQESWFASNEDDLLYRIPGNLTSTSDVPYVHALTDLAVAAVGKHNNSLVLGGMSGTRLTDPVLAGIFSHWKSVQQQNQTITKHDTLDNEYIMYSEPGGAENDIPFQVFMAALGAPGSYEADFFQGVAYGRVEDGLIGFFKPRECGAIRHLRQLGNDLIVYGKNGVSKLVRGERGYDEVPLSDSGIPTSTAVTGDDVEHLFINNRKELCRVRAGEGGVERLDYAHHIDDMTQSAIVATMDPIRRYFWFTDSTQAFCYTGFGLSYHTAVRPMSLLRLDGSDELLGTWATTSDTERLIVGPIVSQPNNQTFEVSSMDVTAIESSASSWTATADWRFRQSDQFRRPTYQDVTDRGRTFVKKTGKDFRPVLRATGAVTVDVDSVTLSIGIGKPSLANVMDATDTILSETLV